MWLKSCEFGACGSDLQQAGAAAAPVTFCQQNPALCATAADAALALTKALEVGVMLSSDKIVPKKGDNDLVCSNRYTRESNACYNKFGSGGKFGINQPKRACLQRAFFRYEACINGTPDPGPPMASLVPARDKDFGDAIEALNTIVIDFGANQRSAQ